jgi:hypothetical protein
MNPVEEDNDQLCKRKAVQEIMKDASLTAHEKHKKIQALMTSGRKSTEVLTHAKESYSKKAPDKRCSEHIEAMIPDEPETLLEGIKKLEPEREKNPRFVDVEETGKWGQLEEREVYGVFAFGCILVIGTAIALGILFAPNEEESSQPVPEIFSMEFKFASVIRSIENSNQANYLSDDLLMPRDLSFYEGLATQESSPAHHRAMSWFLNDNYEGKEDELSIRFVLAILYYKLGGQDWEKSTYWLSSESTCGWEGVDCDITTGIFWELGLDSNNLNGTIPEEISLLGSKIRSISFDHNHLYGTIPGRSFGELKALAFLYLEDNYLTGTVPSTLATNGVLRK